MNSAESLPRVGLRFMASFFAPPLYFVVRKSGGTVGAAATHIYDVPGCGEPDLLLKGHCFSEKRFGKLDVQEKSFVQVSMEVSMENDFSATSTQEDFAENLKFLSTSPKLWASQKEPLWLDETKMRQCKLRELHWVAAVSRPDISARLAGLASRTNSIRGSHAYRINELIRAVKGRQNATVRKSASPSRPWRTLGGVGKAKDALCSRGGKMPRGLMSFVGRSDAAYADQSTAGKRRPGYIIGLTSSRLTGTRLVSQ